MNKNFSIEYAQCFVVSDERSDVRELLSLRFQPGPSASIEIIWALCGSNERAQISFSNVHDFVVKGRDQEYPIESSAMLKIVGFSNGRLDAADQELYLEAVTDVDYMTFIMDDASAILIRAETAILQRV